MTENQCGQALVSFPGPVCSLLAVQNSHRWPGLVHYMICVAGRVITSADNVCHVAESMYNGVRS